MTLRESLGGWAAYTEHLRQVRDREDLGLAASESVEPLKHLLLTLQQERQLPTRRTALTACWPRGGVGCICCGRRTLLLSVGGEVGVGLGSRSVGRPLLGAPGVPPLGTRFWRQLRHSPTVGDRAPDTEAPA